MTETLVERRRRLLRDEIGMIAVDLFASRGFDAVTVDDIAEAAGISGRTFFRYFRSKDLVLLRDQERRIGQLREALASRPDDEPVLDAVRHALLAMAADYEADRDHAVRWAQVIARTPSILPRFAGYAAEFMGAVTGTVAERMGLDPSRDLRPGVVAVAMTGATHVAYEQWLLDGSRPLPERAEEALRLVEQGTRAVVRGAGGG